MTDPSKASYVAENFGTYLRQNLESLEYEGLIPLEKELAHTRVYSEIEMIRFPKIEVIYDIDDNDILLPPLTIQPLVENSIRHGVRERKNGRVEVHTRYVDGHHEIIVKDNGVGFDPDSLEPSTGGKHIGMNNVRDRIEEMCQGVMEIDSNENGTTITIKLRDDN